MSLRFLILGAQKAATSSLAASLAAVDGVYLPKGESAFFEDPEFGDQLWLKLGQPGSIAGIKRPNYLCEPIARKRISSEVPDGRFIVVLREPISRAVSAYYHLLRHGLLAFEPIHVAFARAFDDIARGEATTAATLITYGFYGASIRDWYACTSGTQFLVLGHREVVHQLPGVLDRCCAHIGAATLSHGPKEAAIPPQNVGMYDPRSVRLYRVGQLIRTRPYGGQRTRRVLRRNPLAVMTGTTLTKLAERIADDAAHPDALPPDLRERLEEIYAQDLGLLRQLVPKDAIDWDY